MGETNVGSGSDLAIDVDAVLDLFASISARTAEVLDDTTDWSESGRRAGQYRVDLDVDEACVPPLLEAGYGVLSEEAGLRAAPDPDAPGHVVVVDPLDGSTNASLGLPWCNTALCLVADGVPVVAMVTNLVTRDRFTAVRGSGAAFNGAPIEVSGTEQLADAIIAINGWPPDHFGWRQYRALGSSALDIAYVGLGSFDGVVDWTHGELGVWDYLAAQLVVEEAGGVVVDAYGRDLVVLDHEARRAPIAAATPELLDELLRVRR